MKLAPVIIVKVRDFFLLICELTCWLFADKHKTHQKFSYNGTEMPPHLYYIARDFHVAQYTTSPNPNV